mgnify:FL=1
MKNIMIFAFIFCLTSTVFADIIGHSVQGRDITVEKYGENTENAIVIMGGIHGKFEGVTVELMVELKKYFSLHTPNVSVYIIENINPDTFFVLEPHTSDKPFHRFNQNRVDLNRNWLTSSWKADVTYNLRDFQRGAGGSSPMSEPEVQAVSSFILGLKSQHDNILVINYHSFIVSANDGIAQPSYTGSWDHPIVNEYASNMAKLFVSTAGIKYKYLHQWTQYEVPGEFLNWAGDNNIAAIDIDLPNARGVNIVQEWKLSHYEQNLRAILAIISSM